MATLCVNTGKAIQANRVSGLGGTPPSYIGIGSGTGTTAATDTTLFTEYTTGTWSGYARVNATPTLSTTSVTNDTINWQATFTAPAAETVTNGGNFDASTAGNLFDKGDFTGVALASGDSLQLTIKHQYT